MVKPRYSLVIPVYKNEDSLASLFDALNDLTKTLDDVCEVVFVVDGSPDRSEAKLEEGLRTALFPAQLVSLSRNFGAFAAIRCGLCEAKGDYIGVMAADLQEPPALMRSFFEDNGWKDMIRGSLNSPPVFFGGSIVGLFSRIFLKAVSMFLL
jgi:glycosyltransferase involved in cell wall biosynthesis